MKKLLYKSGFTLAEMLVVVLIISIIAAASIPLAHKRFKINKDKIVHGRYECYYNGASLHEVIFKSGKLIKDEDVSSCKFEPDKKATYFIVQAIGGGGGGAYSGLPPSRVAATRSTGVITPGTPTSTNQSYDSAWLSSALTSINITVTGTAYGGGGGGGYGNGSGWNWASGSSAASCAANMSPTCSSPYTCAYFNNNINGCHWTYTKYRGGPGGKGQSVSQSTRLYMTTSISASSGNQGYGANTYSSSYPYTYYSATGGDPGYVVINGSTYTAAGGTAGGNATPSADGSPGTPTTSGSVAGGDGGYGMNDPSTGEAAEPGKYAPGQDGSYSSPSISPSSVTYSYNYATQVLKYGDGGSAGTYVNRFFTKMAANPTISIGVGGLGGTSVSDYDANATLGDGQAGGNTTVGSLVAAGGAGGKAIHDTSALDLFRFVKDGAYTSDGVVYNSSTHYLSKAGLTGTPSSFYTIYDTSTPPGYQMLGGGATLFGTGGNGGGSSACNGFTSTATLSPGGTYSIGQVGSASCNANNMAAGNNGSQGQPGAVVIIW